MQVLTSEEFSEVSTAYPMSIYPSHYAYSAYEEGLAEPTADELVRLYYTAPALFHRYDADLDPGSGVLCGLAGGATQQKAAFVLQ
jgi:hypothetical protein